MGRYNQSTSRRKIHNKQTRNTHFSSGIPRQFPRSTKPFTTLIKAQLWGTKVHFSELKCAKSINVGIFSNMQVLVRTLKKILFFDFITWTFDNKKIKNNSMQEYAEKTTDASCQKAITRLSLQKYWHIWKQANDLCTCSYYWEHIIRISDNISVNLL